MSYRKFAIALLAVVVVGAIAASSSWAAGSFEESGSAAYIGPAPGTKLTGSKVLKTKLVSGALLQMETVIAGTPIKTEATGYSCIGCTIENSGTNAVGKGKLEATGVHIVEPSNCEDGPTITSKQVRAVLGMKKGSSTIATIKFEPLEGTTFETAEIKGSSCPIAGLYKVTGAVYAEVVNFTGVFAVNQRLKITKAIQVEASGETSALKFGASPAYVTATAEGYLEGEQQWAAKEK
jgi:hypothetical protein